MMNGPRPPYRASPLWAALVIVVGATLLLVDQPLSPLVALVALVLFVVLGVVVVTLTIQYRRRLAHSPAWLAILVLFLLGALLTQGVIPVRHEHFALLGNLLFFTSGCSLLVTTGIILFHRDLGLTIVGWITIISLWSLVITWGRQGDLINVIIQSLQGGRQDSVWWLGLLIGWTCCLVPMGLLSFVWHTAKLLRREMLDQDPSRILDPVPFK